MTQHTSERHTELLNAYMGGRSDFKKWARKNLGEFTLDEWGWGHLEMSWEIDDRFIMPGGFMFGGHIASVADHVVGLAAMTVLTDSKERFVTSRLETNYFRPLMQPSARIEARVTNASKTLIHVEADFFNADEKLANRITAVQMRRLSG